MGPKEKLYTFASSLISRSNLARGLGESHDGDRKYYDTLGYKTTLYEHDYLNKYLRQDIAKRIVDTPPQATWRRPPSIDPEPENWRQFTHRTRLWHMLERADRASRLGRYGVLVIGLNDGRDLDKPAKRVNGLEDVLFFAPYREENVKISELEHNAKSPRFLLPKMYEIDLNADLLATSQSSPQRDQQSVFKKVHHSRVVHIAEGLLEDDIYGVPALQPVYNLLDDLLKVNGGAAEMFWLSARQGLNINVLDDAEMDPEDEKNLDSNLEDYFHELTRVIKTRNAEVKQLEGEKIDPSGPFQVIQQLIAAATGLPARVLFGSEQGELASTQDSISFAQKIMERQQAFAEPMILRALIEKLQNVEALPSDQDFEISWPDPMTLGPDAQAEVMRKEARAGLDLQKIMESASGTGADPVMTPEQFRQRWFPEVGGNNNANTE